MTTAARPHIGFGQVRHTRLRPVHHAFAYSTYFLMLPMRAMARFGSAGLAHNRRGLLSFHDADHGDGRPVSEGGVLGWLDALLHQHGIMDATGEAWLHCYPRVLGYTFKPVSFWYCHTPDGELRAVVVEVNNTFGDRHCYLLDAPRYGEQQQASKVMHVSPFCQTEGNYRFRFMRTGPEGLSRTVVRIDHDDDQGPLLQTSVSGVLEPLSPWAVRRALWRYPAMTLGVILHIHWQAFKLWRKHIPFISRPAAPRQFVTRSNSSNSSSSAP